MSVFSAQLDHFSARRPIRSYLLCFLFVTSWLCGVTSLWRVDCQLNSGCEALTFVAMSCANDGSAQSIDRAVRLIDRATIDGSLVSASNGRSRNHRSIVQRYLWIGLASLAYSNVVIYKTLRCVEIL